MLDYEVVEDETSWFPEIGDSVRIKKLSSQSLFFGGKDCGHIRYIFKDESHDALVGWDNGEMSVFNIEELERV